MDSPGNIHGKAFELSLATASAAYGAGFLILLSRAAAGRTGLFHGKADGAARAAVRLFQRHRDLRLDVAAPPGKANTRAAPAAASEEGIKKVAEATDTIAASEQVAQVSNLYMERLWRSGRRSEVHPGLPLGAQVVIAPAFLGVGKDLVSLVDLFEVLLRRLIPWVHVGVELAGGLPVCLLDLIFGRVPRNAQRLVIVAKLDGHQCTLCLCRCYLRLHRARLWTEHQFLAVLVIINQHPSPLAHLDFELTGAELGFEAFLNRPPQQPSAGRRIIAHSDGWRRAYWLSRILIHDPTLLG